MSTDTSAADPATAAPTATGPATTGPATDGPTGPGRGAGRSWPSRLLGRAPQLILVAWALVVAVPLAWILMSSLKTNAEIYRSPLGPPGPQRPGVYGRAWAAGQPGACFRNPA